MAPAFLKGIRKTYSFEERRILISLINKYEIIESRKSSLVPTCKRRSVAWSLIAEDYNSLVGPQAARSAVQLRRCWENMKVCKRNREEKKSRTRAISQWTKDETRGSSQCWEVATCGQNTSETPTSTGTVGLPPNVLFEPTDSEPFTLQSVCTPILQKPSCSNDADSCQDSNYDDTFKQVITDENKCDTFASFASYTPIIGCQERSMKTNADSLTINQSAENIVEKNHVNSESSTSNILTPPSTTQQYNRKRVFTQREEELHMLALSEAQIKVDVAAMLKEEARIKLEEAHYRKEEARLRMLLVTYKLDRAK